MLDGGSRLQCIPWTQGAAYRDNVQCTQISYVTKKCGEAIIGFDGYKNCIITNRVGRYCNIIATTQYAISILQIFFAYQ